MLDLASGDKVADAPPDLRRIGVDPDHWYPLAWSRDLAAGQMLAVSFAGDPIVLVRPRFGALYALEDRCAHRQVPLHQGVVAPRGLRCGYHGWTYDASGACVDVPYIGRGKLPNGVRAYPVAERAGLIFVYTGRDSRAPQPLPDLACAESPAYKTRRFGREVACHYSFMHENLMDMNHQFLHRRLMGTIVPRYLGRRVGADWIEVDYSFSRTEGKQPWGERVVFGSRRAEDGGDVMTIRTGYPHQTLQILAGNQVPVMKLWIAYVPQDRAQRTNRTFGLISIQRPRLGFLLDAAWPLLIWFTESIFREDRMIVEAEQRAHDAQGADWNQEVFPPIQDLRAILARNGLAISTDPPRRFAPPCLLATQQAE